MTNKMVETLCPVKAIASMTEIRLDSSVKFIELYNWGWNINLKDTPLEIQGFVGSINTAENFWWNQGTFLVLYDAGDSAVDYPDCDGCGAFSTPCTANIHPANDNNYEWCSESKYLGLCDSACQTYANEVLVEGAFLQYPV